ncbi:amino acid adenylation domain-containing protein [Kitasatospora sp. NPDC097643]|uniref:amino acid adenylation domain-containing protein n=1 Tax=Kitasatospora sp. NPDC097643 TaxID=3157230 RepID=UPI003334041A
MSHGNLATARLDELFTAQVRRTPDALALVYGQERLTYQQLHARATAVAERLTALGVREESLVTLAFHRSAEAVVAILGTVLAGAAYLPVSPAYPRERIAGILEDSGSSILLCGTGIETGIADAVPAGVAVRELPALLAGEPGRTDGPAPERRTEARAADGAHNSPLAYVMYTSGSTGRPKGVMVEHAGVVRLVRDTDYFDFAPTERYLQTGALEFDAATFEIWGALLSGAVLHLVDQETLLTPALLKQALREADTTVLWLTSPLFNQLVDEDVTLFAGLRTLIVGGDVLSCRHVNLVREACPELRVLNGYGPTENTTFTTIFPVEKRYESAIPIGRPIRGTGVAVLDAEQRPVPVGGIGELYTSGTGLARGYLNNPGLTAEKFVFVDGVRYYRTGDLVSSDPDGLLAFHGRVDNQVKVRGHRIELGEIDNALLEIPGTVDSHTLVATGPTGVKQLVSYAVLAGGRSTQEVLTALRRRLPAYMCPDVLVAMDRLPLNANGKVDRAKLPAPEAPRGAGAAPGTPTERALAALWAEVLHVDADGLGLDDDFFLLGGSSITAGVLIGRLARDPGVTLGFAELFATRTLGAMAKAVDGAEATALRPVPPATGSGVLHPQQRAMYALWQMDRESLVYNIPVRVAVSGSLDPERLREALAAMTARHDALRTRFTTTGEDVRRVVEPAVPVELEVRTADGAPDDGRPLALAPFDLETAPLMRAVLVRGAAGPGAPGGDVLHLDFHHIVFDGISLRVFVDELFDCYTGQTPPAAPVDYAAAAEWASERLTGEAPAADERYWLERFAEPVPALALPTDRPRPALRSTVGTVAARELSAEDVERVQTVAVRHGSTPFVVLLTAWTATLARLCGQRDLTVGSPMGGRPHPDLENVLGMFVNTVVLRAGLRPGGSLGELLADLGTEHGRALDHQEYPFASLVQRLGVPRDLSRNALFDAFFALQNIEFHDFRKDGRRITVSLPHAGTCRFDLNLQAYQKPSGLLLELEYSTALFDRGSAEFLLDRVVETLRELDLDPGGTVLPEAGQGTAAPVEAADFAF